MFPLVDHSHSEYFKSDLKTRSEQLVKKKSRFDKLIETSEEMDDAIEKSYKFNDNVANFLMLHSSYRKLLKEIISLKPAHSEIPTKLLDQVRHLILDSESFVDAVHSDLFRHLPINWNTIISSFTSPKEENHWDLMEFLDHISVEDIGDFFLLLFNAGSKQEKWKRTSKFNSWTVSNSMSNKFDIQSLFSITKDSNADGKYDLVISFPGTKSLVNLYIDFQVFLADAEPFGLSGCKIHQGFFKAFNSIREELMSNLMQIVMDYDFNINSITFNGHSLGGGLAYLFYLYLTNHFAQDERWNEIETRIFTVGMPPFGDSNFATKSEALIKSKNTITANFRFKSDIIAVPPSWANVILKFHYPYQDGIYLSSLDWPERLSKVDHLSHRLSTYAYAIFMSILDHLGDDFDSQLVAYAVFTELVKENLITFSRWGSTFLRLIKLGYNFILRHHSFFIEIFTVDLISALLIVCYVVH